MTTNALLLIVATLLLGGTDWWAVATANTRLEYVMKPATMIPMVVFAATAPISVPSMRWWFVVALVASLAGDVFLMLPDDRYFIAGLGSFFVGHVAYIGGFLHDDIDLTRLVIAIGILAVLIGPIGVRVVSGARRDQPDLALPVVAYIGVISVMVIVAAGTGNPWAIAGALLFLGSDSMIGWSRFVGDFASSHLAIMVTYHLGQLLLTLSLVH